MNDTSGNTQGLVGDLMTNATDLMRSEIKLFRAEISEKSTQAATALGMIVGGIVMVLVALIVLAFALVAALENAGLPAGWAAVVVGLVFAIIAYVLIDRGAANLKAANLSPDRTADSLSKDGKAIKGAMS